MVISLTVRRTVVAAVAGIVTTACYEVNDPPTTPAAAPVVLTGVRTLKPADTSGIADNASLIELIATVDSAVSSEQTVKFRTTAGSFGGAAEVTVPIEANHTARAQLRAPADSTMAIVTATASGGTQSAKVRFDRALPQRILLSASQFYVRAGVMNDLTLTATVFRLFGRPSPGAVVEFAARDLTGVKRGQLSNAGATDTNGATTVRFTSLDTVYTGPVWIVATTRTTVAPKDSVVKDSALVQVIR